MRCERYRFVYLGACLTRGRTGADGLWYVPGVPSADAKRVITGVESDEILFKRVRDCLRATSSLRNREGVARMNVDSERDLVSRYYEVAGNSLRQLITLHRSGIDLSNSRGVAAVDQLQTDFERCTGFLLEQFEKLRLAESKMNAIGHRLSKQERYLDALFGDTRLSDFFHEIHCQHLESDNDSDYSTMIPPDVAEYFALLQSIAIYEDRILEAELQQKQRKYLGAHCSTQADNFVNCEASEQQYLSTRAALYAQINAARYKAKRLKRKCKDKNLDIEAFRWRRLSNDSSENLPQLSEVQTSNDQTSRDINTREPYTGLEAERGAHQEAHSWTMSEAPSQMVDSCMVIVDWLDRSSMQSQSGGVEADD